MATEMPKQTVFIKDLATKSVTLYPSRAHIVRDIHDILLKPGVNEVEIFGLTPTIDEHSVQVDGKGAATIVSMTVELVPNRDIFEEVYEEDSESESESDDENPGDSEDESDLVKQLAEEIKHLKAESAKQAEIQNSANQRLSALDNYLKSVNAQHNGPEDVAQTLKQYEESRADIFEIHDKARALIADINTKLKRKQEEHDKAGKESRKQKARLAKARAKEARKKSLRRAEKLKAAQYLREERLRFWPKKVYRILLQLETNSMDTPALSRRTSLDSITLAQYPAISSPKEGDTEEASSQNSATVSLSLSYVTREASWAPRYDIKISSVNKTAAIVYRTEFFNHTSETWADAKMSFSTSQTSYKGMEDTVPRMHPWRVQLSKYPRGDQFGLLSPEEKSAPSNSGKKTEPPFDRASVFGKDNFFIPPQARNTFNQMQQQRALQQAQQMQQHMQQLQQHQQMQQQMQQQQPQSGALFGAPAAPPPPPSRAAAPATFGVNKSIGGGLFGASSSNAPGNAQNASADYQSQLMLLEQQNRKRLSMARQEQDKETATTLESDETSDQLDFADTTWEDNGLTSTYDIPQPRTLSPSSQTRHHKIASLIASNIFIAHIAVPKLRSAAFLRTKIRNPSSSITLLKGSAGVTLDGSFLGTMSIPRTSPLQEFDLPLGVDPSIHVSYPKPSVKRSTQGFLTKESAQMYTRNIWLTNTKSTPVDIQVSDQLPVSEEEKLRFEIRCPYGLAKEGDSVRAGVDAKEAKVGEGGAVTAEDVSKRGGMKSNGKASWGSAVATLGKDGRVTWNVKMEGKGACLLRFEYEAKLPTSEYIVPA